MSVASNQHLSLVKTTSIISRNCTRKNNRPPKFLDLASKNLSFLALYFHVFHTFYERNIPRKKKKKRSKEEARETELKNKITEEKK